MVRPVKLSLIFPAYNEENIIKDTLEQVIDFLDEKRYSLSRVERNKGDKIKDTLSLLRRKSVLGAKLGAGEKLVKKFRYVVPEILVDGESVRLTRVSSIFPKLLRKHREINRQGLDI